MPFYLRSLLLAAILSCLLAGCQSSSGKKDDNEYLLEYTEPKPATLTKQEIRQSIRAIEHFYDSSLKRRGFNGAFLVARKGNILFEQYQGAIHVGQKDPILHTTPFHIASTSKTFTAVALLQLAQEGKCQLTDSLVRYFPQFPFPAITIQMLLCHRSGLRHYGYFLEDLKWDKKKRINNEGVLQAIIDQKPHLEFEPGKRFSYSNTNYVLLALLIEKLSGLSYPAYLHTHFFQPLKMHNTKVFTWADSATATPSYRANGTMEALTWLDETYGDKNIYSTVRDLLKWDQALYTDYLLTKEWKQKAFAPYSFERPGIHNYGLGWRMYTLPQEKNIVYHNGWWHGNNSCFYRVITDSLTIIVLGNKINNNIYKVKPLIEALTPLRFQYNANE